MLLVSFSMQGQGYIYTYVDVGPNHITTRDRNDHDTVYRVVSGDSNDILHENIYLRNINAANGNAIRFQGVWYNPTTGYYQSDIYVDPLGEFYSGLSVNGDRVRSTEDVPPLTIDYRIRNSNYINSWGRFPNMYFDHSDGSISLSRYRHIQQLYEGMISDDSNVKNAVSYTLPNISIILITNSIRNNGEYFFANRALRVRKNAPDRTHIHEMGHAVDGNFMTDEQRITLDGLRERMMRETSSVPRYTSYWRFNREEFIAECFSFYYLNTTRPGRAPSSTGGGTLVGYLSDQETAFYNAHIRPYLETILN